MPYRQGQLKCTLYCICFDFNESLETNLVSMLVEKTDCAPYSTLVKHCMKHFMSAHGSHWMAKKRNLAFVIFADRNIIALQTQPPLFSIKEYVNRLHFLKYWVVKSQKKLLMFANIPHIDFDDYTFAKGQELYINILKVPASFWWPQWTHKWLDQITIHFLNMARETELRRENRAFREGRNYFIWTVF